MLHTAAHRPAGQTPLRRSGRPSRTLAIVSTYPPRACGIATFTRDLRHGLTSAAPDLGTVVVAVDRDGLSYGPEVAAVIDQDDPETYPAAARRLAASGVDAVLIQHEYGIFGGGHGAWVNDFAAALAAAGIPYLVTLHTVLSQPADGQVRVLRQLCAGAAAITVFTPTAARLAAATGIADPGRIRIVPHGAPPVLYANRRRRRGIKRADPRVRPEIASVLSGLRDADATVASTFGLISPGKGLETGITAVARLADRLPRLRYVIAGATHPEIVRRHGEHDRRHLACLAGQLGIADRIVFLDHFLTDAEIAAVLHHSDVFLTPYRSPEQISSGALTFALAAGVPAVSTAYHYAVDTLSGGAGVTVPCDDVDAFTDALHGLLTTPARLARATAAARSTGDRLTWPAVADHLARIIRSTTPRPTTDAHHIPALAHPAAVTT